jgi:hypothetical protein
VLRWRERDALKPFDRPEAELVASDVNDKVTLRRTLKVDAFGAVAASFIVPATVALGTYTLAVQSGDQRATSAFEVQEYRKPEFEVIVTPASRFVLQGREAVVSVQARSYFGQPVANGHLRWVVNRQPYYSPLRWDEGFEGGESSYWYGRELSQQGELRLDANGRAELRVPVDEDENGRDYSARIEAQVSDAGQRQVSGDTVVHATWGSLLLSSRLDRSMFAPGSRADVWTRAVDYVGTPRSGVADRGSGAAGVPRWVLCGADGHARDVDLRDHRRGGAGHRGGGAARRPVRRLPHHGAGAVGRA